MPYSKINPTGCGIHKNRAKLRLDFYLSPEDPNYEKYPDIPFHSHFIYPASDITDHKLNVEITKCLEYFYAFYQHCWSEDKEFIDEWKKVPSKAGEVRCPFIKGKVEDISANEAKVQSILSRPEDFGVTLTEVEPQNLNIGDKGTIDIGAGATDRTASITQDRTTVDLTNPANATGSLDTFEVWVDYLNAIYATMGTFYGSGTDYTSRDYEELGAFDKGSKKAFTGLACDVESGDFIGFHDIYAKLERGYSGGGGLYTIAENQFGAGEQTYTLYDNDGISSLYGTGIESGGWTNISHAKGIAAASMSHKKGIAVGSISHIKGVAV